jgi:glycosyltransferase involved in cell wall biosynthesis
VESYAPSATEVLIVNDGSNDAETLEILHHLSQAGYTIINQANVGLSTTRNRLAALAKADIILPLDADNRILPEFIEQGLQVFASQPQMGVVYGDRLDFGLRNNIVNVPEFDLGLLLKGNYIDACALIRKQVINDCDGYDPHLQALEDWELWIHAVAKGWQFAKLPLTCFEYRVRPNSMVSALQNPEFLDNCMQYVQHKHHELYSPWLREKVLHLEGEIQSLNSRFALLETQRVQQEQILEQIINSRSWRITAPLRKVLLYFRNLVNHKC